MNTKLYSSFHEYLASINPLTIGELKEMIKGLPDNTQILIGIPAGVNPDSDWFNVSHNYERPDTNEEYSAFTLFLSDNYDSRQF